MRTPGAKGAATRQRMLDAGVELMRGTGLAGAGINDLVAASGAPKGSVYHFFPGGKQQVVGEALALYAERVHALIDAALAGASTPAGRVRALFAAFAARLQATDFRQSCAAGAVTLDLGPELEGIRAAISAAFTDWRDLLARGIGLADRRRARSFAGLVLTAIEGAYIRGRAERSSQPFLEAGRWLAEIAEREPAAR
jgi:TetR/AcrR family transcriptional repressor of lmrAB and yxaGH operons